MFKVLYNHVNDITNKIYKFPGISYLWFLKSKLVEKKFPIYNDWKKEKLKLKQYIQIYKNNDLLLLNLE